MLRPPVVPMGAVIIDTLPEHDSCPGGCVYEPKWDGWRALLFCTREGVHLQSRTGRSLGQYFGDVVRLARGSIQPGAVLDGELIVWDATRGRTSFVALQRRIAGGAPVSDLPAHFVAFDLLQAPPGTELLGMPLSERRRQLEQVLSGAPTQLQVCPQTDDPDEATEWFTAWTSAGVEGLVIKGRTTPYEPGRKGWRKLRHRGTTEAVIAGDTGDLETLLLGRYDADGQLVYVGRTHALSAAQRRELRRLLSAVLGPVPGGHPWPQPLPANWSGPRFGTEPADVRYRQLAPRLVAEVEADTAHDFGRRRPRFVRVRTDLTVADVPLAETPP
jgi:ATP-dependent DNA ligase